MEYFMSNNRHENFQRPEYKPVQGGRGLGQRGRGGPGAHLGMIPEKPKDFKKTLKRLIKFLSKYNISIFIVLILTIAATIFTIFAPKITGNAITIVFQGMMDKANKIPGASIDFHALYKILLNLSILYLFSIAFNYAQQYIMAGVAQSTVKDLREKMMQKMNKLPLKYFDSKTHGEILSRFTNDIDTISSTLQQGLVQVFSSVISIVGVIIMMLTINPILTLITVLTLPLSILATSVIAKQSQKHFRNQQKILGQLNGHIEESFSGHIVIKAYNREKNSIENFENINNSLYDVGWKSQFFAGIIMPLMTFIGNIGYVVIAVVGGYFVTKRLITIGDIQAFIQYSHQFTQPIIGIANIVNLIQSTIASAERVFEVLDENEQSPDPAFPVDLRDVKGQIDFDRVYFSYDPEKKLIENITFSASPGDTIAIVGPTGAGKTTLVNLLLRFYELDKGNILIDSVKTTDMTRSRLRKIFAMVLQDTWLFSGSIKENIAYGKENAREEEIIEAAKNAHAHHFITLLPDGYDTVLNEETSNLSIGEKQLLTIARAFLADPDILILDEATSNVDTLTEIKIQQAMKSLMRNRTSFVIAHRLSTIKNADMILVMNEGKIVESGTHQGLLSENGFYAELYNSQFLGIAI